MDKSSEDKEISRLFMFLGLIKKRGVIGYFEDKSKIVFITGPIITKPIV